MSKIYASVYLYVGIGAYSLFAKTCKAVSIIKRNQRAIVSLIFTSDRIIINVQNTLYKVHFKLSDETRRDIDGSLLELCGVHITGHNEKALYTNCTNVDNVDKNQSSKFTATEVAKQIDNRKMGMYNRYNVSFILIAVLVLFCCHHLKF